MNEIINQIALIVDFIVSLKWTRIEWLWFLFMLPILGYWLAKKLSVFGKWSSWIKEPMLSLLVTNKQQYTSSSWLVLVFAFITVIALLGPAQQIENKSLHKSKVPMFIVLDLSLSMLSEDVLPSRLELVKYRITDMLREAEDGLVSLVVYSGSAHIVTPLTEDIETILFQLPRLNPEIMPVYGSNPTGAFELIAESLRQLNNPSGRIVWFTDEASEKEIQAVATLAHSYLQELVMVTVGTEKGGTINTSTGLLYDNRNQPVMSRVPLALMHSSANQHGVRAYPVDQLNAKLLSDLSTQFDSQKQQLEKKNNVKRWHELGYWLNIPLLLLVIFLMRSRLLS